MTGKEETYCIYCNDNKATTSDHVPPKSIFATPKPSNLITVPSCQDCNHKFHLDDQYFLNIALSHRTGSNKPADKIRQKVIRGIKRSKAKKYSRNFKKSIKELDIKTDSGIYIGTRPAIFIEVNRINNVLKRCVKGIFYKETGLILSTDYQVKIISDEKLFSQSISSTKKFKESIITNLKQTKAVEIGKEFNYRFSPCSDSEFLSAWSLSFYESLVFFALILPTQSQ